MIIPMNISLFLLLLSNVNSFTISATPRFHLMQRNKLQLNSVSINQQISGDITPLWNNIVVRLKEDSKSIGGIIIPGNSKKNTALAGEVVGVGAGKVNFANGDILKTDVNIGDKIMYNHNHGSDVKYNDATHQIITNEEVLLKYHNDTNDSTLESIECIQDNVLVQLHQSKKTTESGIIYSLSNSKSNQNTGIVVKTGPGRRTLDGKTLIPMHVSIGDNVLYNEYSGSTVRLGNEDYIVVSASEILAKWN